MPETLPQWLWFVFYTVGSLGGWYVAILAVRLFVEESRKILARRK